MIGKVIEGRYTGAVVNKFPDKQGFYIQTDDGTKVAVSKQNAISIDDVTKQYPSTAKRTIMVLWNDFETSIIQLGIYEHATTVPPEEKISNTQVSASGHSNTVKEKSAEKIASKKDREPKVRGILIPAVISAGITTTILLSIFFACLHIGILQFSSKDAEDSYVKVKRTESTMPISQVESEPRSDTVLPKGEKTNGVEDHSENGSILNGIFSIETVEWSYYSTQHYDLVVTNLTNETYFAKIAVYFHDNEGTIIGTENLALIGFGPGDCRYMEAENNDPFAYATYTLISAETDTSYASADSEVSVKHYSVNDKKVIIEMVNNGHHEIDSIVFSGLFYENGVPITKDIAVEYSVKPGETRITEVESTGGKAFTDYRLFLDAHYLAK